MKRASFIPPVIALVVAVAWIGTRRQVLAGLEREGATLRALIVAHRPGSATNDSAGNEAGAGPLNWASLTAQAMKYNRTGIGGAQLKKRFEAMSNEEILTALGDVSKLNSSAKNILREMLVAALVQKDAEFALVHLIGQADERNGNMPDSTLYQLETGLKAWATKEPGAAVAWFDGELEKGTFASKRLDGLSEVKFAMESALVSVLISIDPGSATKRLAGMPGETRARLINRYASVPIEEGKQAAFADLVREMVPGPSALHLLENQAYQLGGQRGFQAVSGFLGRINATSDERVVCVERAAEGVLVAMARSNKITWNEVDKLRMWVGEESPAATDRATGKALAGLAFSDYSCAAALAVVYHESTGNDDVLCAFLEGWESRQHPAEARALAEKVADQKRRELILMNLNPK